MTRIRSRKINLFSLPFLAKFLAGYQMLELIDIVAGYGEGEVLKGVSLMVRQGEIVTLLGANGVGKTTTLLTIAGVISPRKGKILWKEKDVHKKSTDEIVGCGISLCPEGRRIFPHLTVLENLRMGGWSRSAKREANNLEKVYHYFPLLKERKKQLGGTLSGGEQQMLAIGRALMSEAEFLMLDEPSLGLAPLVAERIFSILREIHRSGVSILLVEQNARQALKIAHRGYVMVGGKIIFEDTAEKLLANEDVKKAYLGEI